MVIGSGPVMAQRPSRLEHSRQRNIVVRGAATSARARRIVADGGFSDDDSACAVGGLAKPIRGADPEVATKRAASLVHHQIVKLPSSCVSVEVLGCFTIVGGGVGRGSPRSATRSRLQRTPRPGQDARRPAPRCMPSRDTRPARRRMTSGPRLDRAPAAIPARQPSPSRRRCAKRERRTAPCVVASIGDASGAAGTKQKADSASRTTR